MSKNDAINQTDTVLLSYLNSATENEADAALSVLLDREIEPLIKKTLRQKFQASFNSSGAKSDEVSELFSEVKLQVISELKKLKLNGSGKFIHNLNGYVVSITLNAFRQHLRDKCPRRHRLKNKLRYLLTHHPQFKLWQNGDAQWLCGLKKYTNAKSAKKITAETILQEISDIAARRNFRDEAKIIELTTTIFESARTPMPFADLITVVAEIQQIRDGNVLLENDFYAEIDDMCVAPQNNTLATIETREQLEKVWREICALPLRHRRALLLNLKDKSGDGAIRLFPFLRIASIREIAEALEFSHEEFAAIWNDLPWEDLKIAELMKISRQQVINLRQSARAQIVRHFAGEKQK